MARHYASTRFPTSPTELAECLADPAKFARVFPDCQPQAWSDFANAYAAASPIVTEHIQAGAQEALQAGKGGGRFTQGATAPQPARGKGRFYSKHAPGASLDSIAAASDTPLLDYLVLTDRRNDSPAAAEARSRIQNAALSERIPSEGGFLVPEILRDQLLTLMLEHAAIRPRARVVAMDSLRVPYPSIDDVSHTASVYGGVIGYWTEEGAAITPSAPSFGKVVLEAKKLAFYTTIPNELLQDSAIAVEGWLQTNIPAAMAFFEDVAFIGSGNNGTGVGEPQGFLNAPCAIKISTSSAHKFTWANIASAYSRMLPVGLPTAVWLASPDAFTCLLEMAMTDNASNATTVAPPVWLTNMQGIDYPGGGNGRQDGWQLLGRPLIITEKMPSSLSTNTTQAGALSFCCFDYYLLGDRQSVQIAVSEEYAFSQDMTAWRILERVDGRAWPQSALTPAGTGGSTLSPFVLIDTTA